MSDIIPTFNRLTTTFTLSRSQLTGKPFLPTGVLPYFYQDTENKPDEIPDSQKIQTDAEYEEQYGLKQRLDKLLVKVKSIHGQTFTTEKICCKPDGKVKFTFDKAYSGNFLYPKDTFQGPGLKTLTGMYVKITIQPEKTCCKHIKIIQIKRGYTIGARLFNWQIDAGDTSPYAADYNFAREGINGKPAQVFDIPGRDKGQKNKRVEYMTIVLCAEKGKKDKPLAYVHWGFDLNEKAEIIPRKPVARCGTPDGLETAVNNWNRGVGMIEGRTAANIDFSN